MQIPCRPCLIWPEQFTDKTSYFFMALLDVSPCLFPLFSLWEQFRQIISHTKLSKV